MIYNLFGLLASFKNGGGGGGGGGGGRRPTISVYSEKLCNFFSSF